MAISSPEELAIGLHWRGAIGYAITDDPEMTGKPEGFKKLKSGRLSPSYVNLRGLTSFDAKSPMSIKDQEDLRELVVSTYGEVIDEDGAGHYDHLLGIPHAMTALAAMVAIRRRDSALSMRTEKKEYGVPKVIEGDYHPDEVVIALDDVVTDGASKLETVQNVAEAGLVVSRFVVLVDREEGGRQAMERAGLQLSAALGMGGITAVLAEQGLITDRQLNWTAEYFQKLVDERVIEQIPPEILDLV